MRLQTSLNRVWQVGLLIGLAGMTLFIVMETWPGTPLSDSIVINKPSQAVFSALIDTQQIDKLSQNIGRVRLKTQGPLGYGSVYERVLFSHGLPNFQRVTVTTFEPGKALTTQTTLVGFSVTYRYTLTPTAEGKTILALQKEGEGGWPILRPLLIHLLTRPEHDGDHLKRVQSVVEALP